VYVTKRKALGGVLGVVVAVLVSLVKPPEPMTDTAMITLGIVLGGVIWMLFDFVADYVAFLAICAFWAIFKVTDFTIIFGTFSKTTMWLLIGALGIGVAASESGLLARLALYFLKIFPATFKGQTTALMVSGICIGPFIPSTTAKAAIVAPMAKSISEAMGYEKCSKGAGGLFAAFYTGYISTAPQFLSASFASYAIVGLLPPEVAAEFTWMKWFISAFPWFVVFSILSYISILLLYNPKTNDKISKEYVYKKLEEMGPWSKNEKLTAGVLILCLLLWMTERVHGVNSALIAVLGCCVLIGLGIYDRKTFRAKVAWDSVVFIGCILSIGDVFPAVGINNWVLANFGESIIPLMSNHVLFLLVLMAFILVSRFVIVSWTACFTLLTILLTPFCEGAGINPWIIPFVTFVTCNTWFVIYQNSPYITSLVAAGGDGEMVTHKQMIKYSFSHAVCATIGILASIPFWYMMGLLK